MASVRFESVSKSFGKKEKKKDVLRNVNFDVQDKEFYCLLGPPGAGKTTMLRVLAGLETPEQGAVYIDDQPVTLLPPKERDVAMFFESLALYPNKTGFENIAFPLRIRKTPENEIRERVMEVARMLRIEYLLDREPRTYSGGEMQRVSLARTIVRRPRVFLLDEPLSNIDALLRVNMRAELKRLQKELGQTVMYATHDQAEGLAMGDRICVVNNGAAQQIDTPYDIYYKPSNRFVAGFIGSPPMNFVDCTYEEHDGKAYLNQGTFKLNITKLKPVISKDASGPELALGVRPEDIRIHDKPVKDSVEVSVYVTEPLGLKTVVNLQVGKDKILKAWGSPGVNYRVGDKKWVEFVIDHVHVIDGKTNRAIV
ncbi:MAG: ABC transporter ATP-binding protein [Candidatus Bathyarchaeia archaeon]